MDTPETSRTGKFTRVRFTYNDDLAFLKEFLSYNPMQNRDGWEIVQKNLELIVGKKFSIRTLKHHLQLLIEIWLKKDKIDKIRSGVEEPLSEKDCLLQEISTLCSEYNFETKRKRPLSKEQQISELGKKARNKYASIFFEESENNDNLDKSQNEPNLESTNQISQLKEHDYVTFDVPFTITEEVESPSRNSNNDSEITLPSQNVPTISTGTTPILREKPLAKEVSTPSNATKSSSNILGPVRKRLNKKEVSIRKNALSYLSDKSEKEIELRKKELELEERKCCIEERRLSLEEKKMKLTKKDWNWNIKRDCRDWS